MPNVSAEFVASAAKLAQSVKEAEEKTAKQHESLKSGVELVADTLITNGFVNGAEKQAVVASLLDHGQAIAALNKIASLVKSGAVQTQGQEVQSMGKAASVTKTAADVDYRGELVRESDRTLFRALGFSV